jgi:hypothetical protein
VGQNIQLAHRSGLPGKIIPNIAKGGDLDQLQTKYDGLLASTRPDLMADNTPLGFELNEQQMIGHNKTGTETIPQHKSGGGG